VDHCVTITHAEVYGCAERCRSHFESASSDAVLMHISSSQSGEITAGVISHRDRVPPRAVAQLAQAPRIFTAISIPCCIFAAARPHAPVATFLK
jgi:hypothetical protein